jgi:inorganic pyrophosphatase
VTLVARVVGGLPMLDRGEADDKIVAVLLSDLQWGAVRDIAELPGALIDRLRHYFATYKALPDLTNEVSIGPAYGREHAETVIRAAIADYQETFAATAGA